MKNVIIITCTSLSALIILDTFNAGHALAMFMFAGVIPGTNTAISADSMLSFFALATGFTLSRLFMGIIRRTSQAIASQTVVMQPTATHHSSNGTMLSAQS